MNFNSMGELKDYILSKSGTAVKLAQERVYQVIHRFVKEYYAEYSPEVYERTYQLFRSLVKSEVKSTGNGWVAEVYFDIGMLDYQIKHLTKWPTDGGYMNPYNGDISSDGSFPNPSGSAQKTMEAAARGEHGGYKVGTAIWTDPLLLLYKDGYNMLKRALVDAGIPVK